VNLELDPSDWRRVTLGDVAAASKEKVDPASGEVERYIAGEHMDTDDLKIHRWGEVGDGYLGPAFHRRFHPGQILYGSRRTYLRKVAVAEFGGVTANTTFVVESRDPSTLVQEFLPFVMSSERFHAFAIQESKGSVNPYVNWSDIARYEFELPPRDEQKRLADLFWAVERHRSSLVTERKTLSVARTTWLSAEVDRLIQEATVSFDKVWAGSPESGWSAPPVDEPTGRYVLSLAALGPDGYRPGQLKNVPDGPELRAATLAAGDLLISRANTIDTVGRAGIFDEARADVSFPDTMMRLRLVDEIQPKFAEAVLSSTHGRAHMRRTAAGSATSMVKINRQSLAKLAFPVVSNDQQETLLRELSRIDRALASMDRTLRESGSVKASLLAQVFGGAEIYRQTRVEPQCSSSTST
jgi:type I restriction enzyme S subunit